MMLDAEGRPMAVPAEGVRFVPFSGGPAVDVPGSSAPAAPPPAPARMMLDAEGRPMPVPAEGVRFVPFSGGPAVDVPGSPAAAAPAAGAIPPAEQEMLDTGARASAPPAGEMAPRAGEVVGGIAAAPGVLPPGVVPGFPASVRHADGARPEPQVDVRSEQLQEVVSFVPHWLVRWGITVVFAVVSVLLAITWLVHYPELVTGQATLTTPEPPVRLVARTGGEVEVLMVADGESVERGAVLAVLRNPADYRAVMRVDSLLRRFDTHDPATGAAFAREPSLGEVQGPYTDFLNALADLRAFDAAPYDGQKVAGLVGQIQDQRRLRESLGAQQALVQEQLAMAERDRDRSRELAARQLISPQELEKAEADYLQKRLALESARNALTSSEIQMAGQAGTLLDVQQKHDDEHRRYVEAVRGAADALRAALDRWRQDYLLLAPTGGRVSFFRPLARGQFVGAAEPVLAVVPSGGHVVAQVLVPQAASGKVRRGQKVIIRFDGFSANEFGTVAGRVEKISLVPDDKKEDEPRYLLQVALPDGLVTSYGKALPFRQEMRGSADVVTEDVRLFRRIFNQLYAIASPHGG
jgi:HlyD family secretion protein